MADQPSDGDRRGLLTFLFLNWIPSYDRPHSHTSNVLKRSFVRYLSVATLTYPLCGRSAFINVTMSEMQVNAIGRFVFMNATPIVFLCNKTTTQNPRYELSARILLRRRHLIGITVGRRWMWMAHHFSDGLWCVGSIVSNKFR